MTVGYYVVHKPFDLESGAVILNWVADVVVALLLLFLALCWDGAPLERWSSILL